MGKKYFVVVQYEPNGPFHYDGGLPVETKISKKN